MISTTEEKAAKASLIEKMTNSANDMHWTLTNTDSFLPPSIIHYIHFQVYLTDINKSN